MSDISNLPYLWHKGQPFLKPLGKQQRSIPLLLRMATAEDVKPTSGPHQTRRLWVQNGKASQVQFLPHLTPLPDTGHFPPFPRALSFLRCGVHLRTPSDSTIVGAKWQG